MTAKSTIHFWVTEACRHNRGPFAGKVRKICGRWYVTISSDDGVVQSIIDNIKTLRPEDPNEI